MLPGSIFSSTAMTLAGGKDISGGPLMASTASLYLWISLASSMSCSVLVPRMNWFSKIPGTKGGRK